KRMENSPIGRALEAIQALAYTSHPYAWTPAGDIGDLERTTMETYRHFYETHYVPNNATLVVVGDVSEKSVRKLAKRYFGAFARGKTPPPICASEPPQKKRRVLNATWASQLNVVLGAYHIPAAKHANIAPLTVLSTILSAGRSSRLHRILVRKKKLAIAAGGFVRELEDPSLFYLYALGLPQHKIATLEKALLAEVDRVQRRPVTAKELQKAKNQLVTGQLHSLESATGVANQIGQSAILQGDPRSFLHDLAELRKVTAADVQRVAKHYLQQANFSVVLLPAGAGKKPSAAKPSAAKPSAAKRGGAR
ncbi:MAG: insulinase family protein, partial [Deltaproteobacteria bacterium]|nr:insulinase family protein [Deltaproteobacteria bacterium]